MVVVVAVVRGVAVSVVDVVDVVTVRDGDMAASLAVRMGMRFVGGVCRCHGLALLSVDQSIKTCRCIDVKVCAGPLGTDRAESLVSRVTSQPSH